MPEVQWEDPPNSNGGRRSPYEWFYQGLREKPGEWAKYPGSSGGATGYSKRHDNYEATTRVVTNGEGESEQQAWMRYVPEELETSDA